MGVGLGVSVGVSPVGVTHWCQVSSVLVTVVGWTPHYNGAVSEWWAIHGEQLVWAVVGIAAGLAISGAFYYLQRRKKTLDWMSVTNAPLLNTRAKLADGLSIYWMNRPVSRPSIMIIRIKNTGREAIRAEDFAQPISMAFDKVQVLVAIVSETSPNLGDISPIHEVGDSGIIDRITIEPRLLNPGEWFDIQLLFDGKAGYPSVSTRFADQSRSMKQVPLVEKLSKRQFAVAYGRDLLAVMGATLVALAVFAWLAK
jgi:hypothetical protein